MQVLEHVLKRWYMKITLNCLRLLFPVLLRKSTYNMDRRVQGFGVKI